MKTVQIKINDGRTVEIGKQKFSAGSYDLRMNGFEYRVTKITHDTFGGRNFEPWYIGPIGYPADNTYQTLNDAISAYYRHSENQAIQDEMVKRGLNIGEKIMVGGLTGTWEVVGNYATRDYWIQNVSGVRLMLIESALYTVTVL
jgi:hypothetical protein